MGEVWIMRIDNDLSSYSVISVMVGTVSLFLWLIPIISIFTAMFTIYTGMRGYDSEHGGLAKAGIFFGVISLVLTILRSGLVNGGI